MPADSPSVLLGVLFLHQHGAPARSLASVVAERRGTTWTYTATSGQREWHDTDLQLMLEAIAREQEQPYYALSIERTFMPAKEVPHDRQIVTVRPV